MSYVEKQLVKDIADLASINVIKDNFVKSADRHIESIIGYDLDTGSQSCTEYFDVEQTNEFYVNYAGERNWVLKNLPVTAITSVTLDPVDNPDVLVADDDYFIDLAKGILTIDNDVEIIMGQRKIKVIYSYGFVTIPNDIKEYASWYCAMLHDVLGSVAKNDEGAVLQEIEIGRYRERYNDSGSVLKNKYLVLADMRSQIEAKYKVWG
jgi:hypothetical protein